MNQLTGPNRDTEQACLLLQEYSFEMDGYRPGELVAIWQERLGVEPIWIRSAVVEALYQGRYKALSVEQILRVWKRRGHPLRHFNHEFERVVFGPIDTIASKYAPLTTLRPSELLKPQKGSLSDSTEKTASEDSEAPSPEDSGENPQESVQPEQRIASENIAVHGLTEETLWLQGSFYEELKMLPSLEPVPYQPIAAQSLSPSHPKPIRKFVPQPTSSEFYLRLQSVARYP